MAGHTTYEIITRMLPGVNLKSIEVQPREDGVPVAGYSSRTIGQDEDDKVHFEVTVPGDR